MRTPYGCGVRLYDRASERYGRAQTQDGDSGVSTDDVRTQNIAMNNAVNLQKALGVDNVAVEIVAYGLA